MMRQTTTMGCSNNPTILLLLGIFLGLLLSAQQNATAWQPWSEDNGERVRSLSSCLVASGVGNFSLVGSLGYATLLNSSIQNLRFAGPGVRKPIAVVLPTSRRGVQHAVRCARGASVAIRVRSGGHSYEGQSYTVTGVAPDWLPASDTPFVVIDLMNLNGVRVDAESATAWVESGATLGEVYYAVARASNGYSSTLAFPAGSCSTIGVGGHVSGGGFGLLSRKFMLAADNVLDAVLVDAKGRVLDRSAMGEDVFWAIRGGGGGSWGVVYAWKLGLVPVPNTVTVFNPRRNGSTDAIAGLVHRWQYVGPALPDEFYLSVFLTIGSSPASSPPPQENGNATTVSFTGLVLGPKELAVSVLRERFPELGLTDAEASETSWVESAAQYAGLSSVDELTSRDSKTKYYGKNKSDYVRRPITRDAMAGILRHLATRASGYVILDPYGGAMARAGPGDTPFPHRAGNLYGVQYGVTWVPGEDGEARMAWLRALYKYMAPHVSCDPRAAYVNYIDLDLGTNVNGSASAAVSRARATWGAAYFSKENFDRLVRAKTLIDPANVFNCAQSIPPLQTHG